MHLVHVLTASQGQGCSQVASWIPELFSKLPQLRRIAKERACVKILQPLALDMDLCQELAASYPKYTQN